MPGRPEGTPLQLRVGGFVYSGRLPQSNRLRKRRLGGGGGSEAIQTLNGRRCRRVRRGGRRNLPCSLGSGAFRHRRVWVGAERPGTDRGRPVRELPRRSCYEEICDCTSDTSTSNLACLRLGPWSLKSDDREVEKDATRWTEFLGADITEEKDISLRSKPRTSQEVQNILDSANRREVSRRAAY